MHNTLIVARREYLTNVRRRSFLFAAFGVPLFMVGLLVLVFAVAVQNETDTTRIGAVGYVDQSGVLAQATEKPDTFVAYGAEDEAKRALEDKQIGAYFVVARDYMTTGAVRLVGSGSVPEAIEDQIDAFLVANLGAQLDNPDVVARLQDPVESTVLTLDSQRTLKESAMIGVFLSPILLVFVVMFSLQMSSGYLMAGVAEEKASRIIEILITSVKPLELLLGKVIGLGALGLTQLAVWVLAAAAVVRFARGLDFVAGFSLPPDLIAIGLLYFVLAYLLFGSIMASIGMIAGSEQEGRQYAGSVTFGLVIPFFLITQFISDPNGPVPLVLSLIPFTAPTTIILRMSYSAVPAWQLGLSVAIMAATTAFVIVAASRVYRWSLLLYGKRPGIRELVRVIRGKPVAFARTPQEQRS